LDDDGDCYSSKVTGEITNCQTEKEGYMFRPDHASTQMRTTNGS